MDAPVNLREARELRRLFVVAMCLLARAPEAITRLSTETRTTFQAGDLTFTRMDERPREISEAMTRIVEQRTALFDTEEEILGQIRRSFDLGTASVAPVNARFKSLYRQVVDLSADDNNGPDPEEVRRQDVAQAAVVFNLLRGLKRSLQELVHNMSIHGILGTQTLVDKWSAIAGDSLNVLNYFAQQGHVVPRDWHDPTPWAILAALTRAPLSTVQVYARNATEGGRLLDLSIKSHEKLGTDLDNEAEDFVRAFFFQVDRVENGVSLSAALREPAVRLRNTNSLVPLWA